MSDPLSEISEAVRDVWDTAEPESVWAVQIVFADGDNDDRLIARIGPLVFPDRERANALAELLQGLTPATFLVIASWAEKGLMSIPENENGWQPLAIKVVELAPVPF